MFVNGWPCVVKMDGTGTGNTGIFTAAWALLLASPGWLFLHLCFCRCGVGGAMDASAYFRKSLLPVPERSLRNAASGYRRYR